MSLLNATQEAMTDNTGNVRPRVSELRHFFHIFLGRKVVLFGLLIILSVIIVAAFAPLLAPHNPYKLDISNALAKPSLQHLLGADGAGRDTLNRIIYGARTSLLVSLVALLLAAGAGMSLGLVAGYFGGVVNTIIMRTMYSLMTIPMMLLAITIAALMGGGLVNVVIALGISLVPAYARLMCGQVISIRENDYVMAARLTGAKNLRIMLYHILPNSWPPLIVMMTMQLGGTILAEAGLSFLGIGIKPPGASWGAMVNDGYKYLTLSPLLSVAPGVAIMLVVFAFNMVGDGLRDALDPRLRGVLR